jgi:omega-hydroxy-beta-dihydromenaquinone-9 sulfotransferase
MQSACWSSLFEVIENSRFRRKIEGTSHPVSPLFIIGHWRTGSTLLHQSLQIDRNMITPTLFQVAEPGCFLSTYGYYRPILNLLLPENRPMDQVKLGMDEPQEDEYALYRLTGFSPLERIVFPASPKYFLMDYPGFVPAGAELEEWKRQLVFFFKKLSFGKTGTLVSKNPFHSLRIKELLALFPDARFIHIYRHPFDVISSSLHLWKIVYQQNCLNRNGAPPSLEDVTAFLDHLWTVVREDLQAVAPENRYEMKFENLEKDPFHEISGLYSYFGFPMGDPLKEDLRSFFHELEAYQKNRFHLAEEEKDVIRKRLSAHMEYFGYQ